MICRMMPFSVTFNDPWPQFYGHGVTIGLDVLDLLCAQLRRDLFAIAKFLVDIGLVITTRAATA